VIRKHVVVRGFVQGVGFRVSAAAASRTRGIGGWVRNRPDGGVEAVFEGPPETVEALLRWCREGPHGARVDQVDVLDEEPEGLTGFEIV
jgi:acylphosphatase